MLRGSEPRFKMIAHSSFTLHYIRARLNAITDGQPNQRTKKDKRRDGITKKKNVLPELLPSVHDEYNQTQSESIFWNGEFIYTFMYMNGHSGYVYSNQDNHFFSCQPLLNVSFSLIGAIYPIKITQNIAANWLIQMPYLYIFLFFAFLFSSLFFLKLFIRYCPNKKRVYFSTVRVNDEYVPMEL